MAHFAIGCRHATLRGYLDAALARNTQRAYAADLKHFLAWGGTIPSSPERVAHYLAQFAATLAPSTLSRRLIAIAQAHAVRGLASPTASPLVWTTLQGVRRSNRQQVRQVAPLRKKDLIKMLRGLKGLQGLRDRALLLLGFAGAFRRSELVSLDVGDLRWTREGLLIHLRRSKTDQDGQGRTLAIPRVKGRYCPCRALRQWLLAAEIESGPLFRRMNRHDQVLPQRLSAQSVALIVKARVAQAGLDPALYSGHSLRAGFVTNAAERGASAMSIRVQTGHQSDAMLQRYIRMQQLFRDNANRKIW